MPLPASVFSCSLHYLRFYFCFSGTLFGVNIAGGMSHKSHVPSPVQAPDNIGAMESWQHVHN